jgi:hypothetical protein
MAKVFKGPTERIKELYGEMLTGLSGWFQVMGIFSIVFSIQIEGIFILGTFPSALQWLGCLKMAQDSLARAVVFYLEK